MASDQQFCLRWNNHQNTLVSIFDSLLESGTLVDCTLAAEGRFLQAHKVVLSACSPYFAMLLREHYDKFPILILKDIKYQELQAMMNYMYRGEVNITQETLGSFLKAAESLQIRGLTDNRDCVENNNGMIRDNTLQGSSVGSLNAAYHSSKKLPSETRKLLGSTPSINQQRSRSPPSLVSQSSSSKKYLKSSSAPIAVQENHSQHNSHHSGISHGHNQHHQHHSNSKNSSDVLENNTPSIKRRKLLPPIKSEGLVVTPINPSSTSTYNNIDANLCEVPSQAQSIPAVEGKANVPSPSIPPKVESPHMDITPVICNKVPSTNNATPNEGLMKPKLMSELVKVKNEQLDDSYNEDTNDDSYTTEDNDNERDEGSHLSMAVLPFHNNQSATNFDSSSDRSLLALDGNNSLQDSPAFPFNPYNWLGGNNWEYNSKYVRLTETNPFSCQHCGKRYRWKSTLKRHESFECGGKEPAHKCPHCDYRAKQSGNLRVHIHSGARIQISRKQSQKLQKLLLEKDGGNGKFTDEEIRRNASRLKIPAVKIRYWLKQRNAFDEGAPAKRPLNKTKMLLKKRRCKLFNDLSYEKKVKLLRKTNKVTKFTVSFNQQMAEEFGVPADQLNNWLRYKIQRNANVKKTLTSGLVASLREKFEEYDYLDEDSAILLADEYNVTVALVKKAFAQRNTPTRSTKKAIAVTPPPPVDSSTAKKSKYKTVDQKNALFEAFRESPTMTKADTIAELCNNTGLRSKQISKWLNVTRSKWSQHNESSAKKLLTRGLKKAQLVELEKAYRRNRFLDDEQLDDLCKRIDKHKRAIQGWFSDRRIYEIRSNDKNIIDVEASFKKVPPAVEHVAESTPASEQEDDDEFFNSLTEDQKAQLVEARTKFNVAYKRLSNQIGIPADKIENYIKSWRIRTNYITRVPNKRNLSDRVHKTLMSHFQQTDKISAKQAVILAKRLNIRPDQVKNWYHSRRRAVRSVGGVVSSANVPKSVPIKQNTPPAVRTKAALKCTNKDKRNRIDVSHKQRLFEEYKKSPQISGSRAILVAAQCGMTPIQVRKWCYNFGKSISEQTLTKVISCLDKDNIGREARAKLEEQYRFRRYIEESEADAIAEEFNLTRTQVNNWFINARYYEILCGEYPGSQKTSESFYDSLDETVRARLKTELKSYPLDDETLDDLAEELDLPLDELKKWFECEACKIRRKSSAAPVQVSIKQKELLDSEFDIDPVVTDDRARTLSKRVHMTMDRIKLWFENRQEEKIKEKEADEAKLVKHKISPITIRMSKFPSLSSKLDQSPPSDSKPSCTIPAQQNKLFEEFKRSSVLNDQRLDELSEQTGLSTKQIQAWFNWLRSKLSSLSKESLTDENRNRNLTSEQLQVLEKEYGESPYIDRTKRNLLSESIDLPKTTIKNWFANKRYHEILYNSSFTVDEAEKEFSEPSEEETENGTETVIDYDWEDESLVPKSTTDGEVSNDNEDEDDRRFDLDALFEPVENDDSDESELELSTCDAFKEDFTSLPYQPKIRFAMPLGKDLEPSEDVEKLFWYVKKTPNKMGGNLDNEIDNEKKRVLESEFSKNPWPVMDRISLLSNKLQVSEPKIHWWFIKKRCFLTKTILNLPSPQPKPAPKNVLIDLTDDDPMTGDTAENDTLEESQIKLERFADDSVENGDSVEDTSFDEPPTERREALQLSNAAQSANDNSTVVKKKKKKLPLTSHQHAILMREFKRKKFISTSRARMLAQDLGLSVTRVESLFEVWRRKIEKKGNSAEKVSSKKTINSTIEAELEAEYLKSSDLNDSRVAAIASNLKILKKVVRKWFLERAKKTEG